ncbi:hypothetical protein ABT009_30350 [Streptomyces sp. NPDC002896]|uniref:hypothetical protein n=1 Tax=Streptomyces sp. NPDC002896 TaxID=3154438 RepID=UPI0033311D3A
MYEASYAALPTLADIATGRASGARKEAVLMAGVIVAESGAEQRAYYAAEVTELLSAARVCLTAASADAPETFVYLVQCLLAFEGVPIWSQRLELLFEEFEAECPECEALTGILLGEYSNECDADLHPARPGELTGIGARVHNMARDAGHDQVAEWVTHLFGQVTCPECETTFTIPEGIANY